ncbi:lytic transglycosylase domain-containing protein [Brevundimonas viscosa]|uniref:Transglycosylase SLT domain-containing protein n=1 Tax=Brevundimonas viscosa TaxID=871741 RepID=A0A1I6TN15_9CAUL|nr:lytic transglycosylase domain-containing protein [Brevundimonas viscosa]SFS90633.1 Transglycosylase SLT domain-containing protein [Brevundimonas viscosa]
MVSLGRLALIALALDPAAVRTPPVDWARAGGELFVEEPTPAPVDEPGAPPEAEPAVLGAPVQPFAQDVERAAHRHGLDPKLLHALVIVESAYRRDAVSLAGAAGLTQLMPATAADLGVRDRFDVEENLSGGADYLARQLLRFGDLRLALAAYNAGPGRVARLGRVPDIDETRDYVASVIDCYLALAAGRRARTARECRAHEGDR